jgi:hypothetical protein
MAPVPRVAEAGPLAGAAAEKWAAKEPGCTPAMIMPKLLEGVVDETGDLLAATLERAG